MRHGRSAHVQTKRVDRAGFLRWREAYEAAGLHAGDTPPRELQGLATSCGMIVTSTARRAIESAALLDPSRDAVASQLLDELLLTPPNIRGIRMPLFAWALAFGVFRRHRATPLEEQRARDATAWLTELASRHQSVLAVTHASFRRLLAACLIEDGWVCGSGRGMGHWSAWGLTRA